MEKPWVDEKCFTTTTTTPITLHIHRILHCIYHWKQQQLQLLQIIKTTKPKAKQRVGFLFRKGKVREKEKAGFYVFGALEFENLREWEYTCTAGIYFMGISRARRFDILI